MAFENHGARGGRRCLPFFYPETRPPYRAAARALATDGGPRRLDNSSHRPRFWTFPAQVLISLKDRPPAAASKLSP
jgi:hypothetical protein